MAGTDEALWDPKQVPYQGWLGIEHVEPMDNGARVTLPYDARNTNMGTALHGGISASLANIAARLAAAQCFEGTTPAQVQLVGQNVLYLAAAQRTALEARAEVLRTGRGLAFLEVAVRTPESKLISEASVVARIDDGGDPGPLADPPQVLPSQWLPAPRRKPSPMGEMLTKSGFIGHLGLQISHMQDGRSLVSLPYREAIGDGCGNHHEGAIAALIDTAGAMAAWAHSDGRATRASTPALQLSFLSASGGESLAAMAEVRWRRRELYLSRVQVAGESSGRICAEGQVTYRIV